VSEEEVANLLQQLLETNNDAIGILSQILEGLVFIRSQGEVHRDLKPENGYLLLSKITDLNSAVF